MEMLSAFSTVVHVSNISTADQLMSAVSELDAFTKGEIHELSKKVDGKKYAFISLHSERVTRWKKDVFVQIHTPHEQ